MNPDSIVELLPIPDAEVYLYRNFLYNWEAVRLNNELIENIVWQQDLIKLYGRKTPIPRLTSWYGDEGIAYTYSGILMEPHGWTVTLLQLKDWIENKAQCIFNSVLLNYYRNGKDSVAWHSDDEPELGKNPTIASLSLGVSRKFEIRSRLQPNINKIEILLNNGDLLIMRGGTQENYQHQIPKMHKVTESRINLTFRNIYINTNKKIKD
jgi:alkylated DNA repair dioxygenase AlkB